MRERGMISKHSNFMWWVDIELVRWASDFVDPDGNPLRVHGAELDDPDG
jgi:hypothetical protein